MSKPRERWWTYVRNCVRAYPELKQRYDQLHELPITRQPREIIDPKTGRRADFYGSGGGGGNQRQVEGAVLRELSPQDQRELDAVRHALEAVELMPSGTTWLQLIQLYHFERRRLTEAAYKAHVSEATARRWNAQFLYLVAKNLELK